MTSGPTAPRTPVSAEAARRPATGAQRGHGRFPLPVAAPKAPARGRVSVGTVHRATMHRATASTATAPTAMLQPAIWAAVESSDTRS